MRRTKMAGLALSAVLAAGSLTGCWFSGGGSDDCQALPAAAALEKPKPKPAKPAKKKNKKKHDSDVDAPVVVNNGDDCDEED